MTEGRYTIRYAAGHYWIIKTDYGEYNTPVMTNEAGCYIWQCMTAYKDIEKTAQMLAEKYSIPYDEALSDTKAFAAHLREKGVRD